MPNYDFQCLDCELVEVHFAKYEDRDLPRICPACEGPSQRIYINLNARTEKTSRTFLDGYRTDGIKEELVAAKLDEEALKHSHTSAEYKNIKAEAATRRLFNSSVGKERRSKYKLSKGKKDD